MSMRYVIAVISALGMASLRGFAADSASPTPSSNTVVAWGKSVDGLRVGVSCDTNGTTSGALPKICFYVANDGDKAIPGIIQSGTECLVAMNGQYYAQESWGGKTSPMPPGRTYGPIPINTERLRQIPDLRAFPAITDTAPRCTLLAGTNTVALYYKSEKKLVKSGELQFVAR